MTEEPMTREILERKIVLKLQQIDINLSELKELREKLKTLGGAPARKEVQSKAMPKYFDWHRQIF
jgi:hypothetical protein